MRQPVTIGDQKFVWSDEKKAWIDDKTKVLVNAGMQSLLEVASTGQFHNEQKEESANAPPVSKPEPPELDKKKEEKQAETQPYNNEPVSIGGQKFIIDPNKGWIDAKTKQPAQKELVKLLEQITGVKVESKKFGTDKIEIEPIIIGDQKYIWDPKTQEWKDAKTKQRADDALQKLLTSTINKAGISKFTDPAETFGGVGAAAAEKIKKKEEKPKKKSETEAVPQSKKAKSLLVTMIGHLKSIDSSFRARSDIIAKQNAREYAEARENVVEQNARSAELESADSTKEDGSPIGKGLGIAAIIGIVALAFDPVKKSLQTAYDYIKSAYDSTQYIYKTLTDGFNGLLGMMSSNSASAAEPVSAPAPAATADSTPKPKTTPTTPSKPVTGSSQSPTITAPAEASASPTQNTPNRVEASAPTASMKKAPQANESSARRGWYKTKGPKNPVPDGKSIVQKMFPQARITSSRRKAGGAGKAGSSSWHVKSGAAVDVAPIPGMSFDTWLNHFRRAGYTIIEAIDETIPANRKITGGTGPHWHVVLGGGGRPSRVSPTAPGETYQEPDNSTDYGAQAMEAEDPMEAMISMVKGFTQMLRVIGKTDSYYLGNLEEIAAKKTNRIGEITAQKYADMVDKNKDQSEEFARMNVLELPNLNKKEGGTVQTPSTSFDKKIVEQYLRYFGFSPKTINL